MDAWSHKLPHPITLKDGRVIRTLSDARTLLLQSSGSLQRHPWNQYAAELLIRAAESETKEDILEAEHQMRRALAREGML